MACRNMTACEKARSEIVENTFNKNVHCRHLDLASLKSVRDFAAEVKKGRECNDKCQRNKISIHCRCGDLLLYCYLLLLFILLLL